jgi:gluconolactonase
MRTTPPPLAPRTILRTFAVAAFAGVLLAPHGSRADPVVAEAKPFGHVERKDPRLDRLIPPDARVERLVNGITWCEGPVWVSDGGYLLFSEIPRNSIYRWKQGEGLKLFMNPSGYTGTEKRGGETGTNGLTLDPEGRLVMCEHGDRRVTRREKDGKKTVLADRFEGKRLNSPNDLVFDAKGNLYFTDPPYGLEKNIDDPKKELPFQGVYRVSREGKLTLVTKDLTRPNGIALSPDEKTMYIAVSDPDKPVLMAYDLQEDGTIKNGRVLFDAKPLTPGKKGLPDGMKLDREGNIFLGGPGGILVLAPDGTHLGTIVSDDPPTANCAWGDDGSTLYITSNTSIVRIKTATKGKPPGKQ